MDEIVRNIPTDLALKIYKNPNKRSFTQRLFHQSFASITTLLIKSVFLRHRFKFVNKAQYLDLIKNRPCYQPLITVSNHHSCMDDFILFGASLPFEVLLNADKLRWTLTSVDICFINCFVSTFFASGKGIPIWRRVRNPNTQQIVLPGLGVSQPSMHFCVDLLNCGHWVHFFSQGRVILPHERADEERFRLRWGIGRLLADSQVDPIVLPIWHCGFDDLNPTIEPYTRHTISRLLGSRKILTAMAGQPFQLTQLRKRLQSSNGNRKGHSQDFIHARLTDAVQTALYALKPLAEKEHDKHRSS